MTRQKRFAKLVGEATLGLVVVLVVVLLYLFPRILSTKDAADLTACRSLLAQNVSDARDVRLENLADGLTASHEGDGATVDRLARENPKVKRDIAQAVREYKQEIRQSITDPNDFLKSCRR